MHKTKLMLAGMIFTAYAAVSLLDTPGASKPDRAAHAGETAPGVVANTDSAFCADRSGPAGYPASIRQQAQQRQHIALPPCAT